MHTHTHTSNSLSSSFCTLQTSPSFDNLMGDCPHSSPLHTASSQLSFQFKARTLSLSMCWMTRDRVEWGEDLSHLVTLWASEQRPAGAHWEKHMSLSYTGSALCREAVSVPADHSPSALELEIATFFWSEIKAISRPVIPAEEHPKENNEQVLTSVRRSSGCPWHGICPRDKRETLTLDLLWWRHTKPESSLLHPPHAEDTRGQRFQDRFQLLLLGAKESLELQNFWKWE